MNAPKKPTFNYSKPVEPKEYFNLEKRYETRLENDYGCSLEEIKIILEQYSGIKLDYKDIQIYIDFYKDYDGYSENNSKAYIIIKEGDQLNPKYAQQMKKYEKDTERYLQKKKEYEQAKKEYPKKTKEYKEFLRQQQIEQAKRLLLENGINAL